MFLGFGLGLCAHTTSRLYSSPCRYFALKQMTKQRRPLPSRWDLAFLISGTSSAESDCRHAKKNIKKCVYNEPVPQCVFDRYTSLPPSRSTIPRPADLTKFRFRGFPGLAHLMNHSRSHGCRLAGETFLLRLGTGCSAKAASARKCDIPS